MSALFFHSKHDRAELRGSEYVYLDTIASNLSLNAYNVENLCDEYTISRVERILNLIPKTEANKDLHDEFQQTQLAVTDWRAANAEAKKLPGPFFRNYVDVDSEPSQRLKLTLKHVLVGRFSDVALESAGEKVYLRDVTFNTALVAGSDEIALAAKLYGYGESHAWVAGPNRAWLADIIQSAFDKGIYRQNQGWESVIEFLRKNNDEPVVTSYSISDSFPNSSVAYLGSGQGEAELDEEELDKQWDDLSEDEQWCLSMNGLQSTRPWLELTPDSLRGTTFGFPVSAYDVIAPDAALRIEQIIMNEKEES